MLIFFGLRSARIESRKINASTSCQHCQSENSFVASIYGNYFHIFWIPVFSTGKAIVVECSHCKKTYHLQDLSSENQLVIQNSFAENPPKKAQWLNLGCFVILAFILFIVCAVIYAKIVSGFDDDYDEGFDDDYPYEEVNSDYKSNDDIEDYVIEAPKPAWFRVLKKDILKSELYPTEEFEPISYALFKCLDPDTIKLGKEDVGYFYRIEDDKILILLEVWNYKELNDTEKAIVYSKIDRCLDDILKEENYERYVGIYYEGELKMQKSPNGMVKDSTAKDAELLKEFYDELIIY
ncbi:zinc-ribbon domain-containing protein [uncultured Winogradskyella sp.]|uniref:zinc-ribbon domain-containing protein n=1 Tax=uncultured Winogradskyella sp. TaxID=395353 RepID=UPI00260886C7|nr:zinc-ribbon domain-containing protein [uncultured Winogradskyella sp.]